MAPQNTDQPSDEPFIKLFGRLELSTGEKVPTASLPRKLFVVLALGAGTILRPLELCQGMWGKDVPSKAEETLQTYIFKLRRVDCLRELIVCYPSVGYSLQIDRQEIDLNRFTDGIQEAECLLNNKQFEAAQKEVNSVRSIMARGSFLSDVDNSSPKLINASEWVDDNCLKLNLMEYQIAFERDQHLEVLESLLADFRDNPTREDVAALAMMALARACRRPQALAIYEKLRYELREQLGLDPSAQLQQLLQLILNSAPIPNGLKELAS